jgi:hypothetical protein
MTKEQIDAIFDRADRAREWRPKIQEAVLMLLALEDRNAGICS